MASLATGNVLKYGRIKIGVRSYAHSSRPMLMLRNSPMSQTLRRPVLPLARSSLLPGPVLSVTHNPWSSRNASTSASSQVQATSSAGDSAIAEAAESVASTVPADASSVVDTLTNSATSLGDVANAAASIPPMQFGDLAALGLASWSPAGIVRWSLELLNVTTHMPWFWTLVVGATFWRLAVAPFTIESIRNSAKLLPKTEQMKALNAEKNIAVANRDNIGLQKVMLKQKALYDEAGVSMGRMALTPFIQLPVTLGTFFGVKTMCELPVQQLTWSGVDFLANLTVPDPTYILPIALTAVINLQITAGARDMNLAERPEMGHIMNGLRVLSVGSLWLLANLPSGLQLTLFVSSLVTAAQSYIIRQPGVRRALGIPIIPLHLQGKLPSYKDTWAWIKNYYARKLEEGKMQAAAQRRMQEAARHKIRR